MNLTLIEVILIWLAINLSSTGKSQIEPIRKPSDEQTDQRKESATKNLTIKVFEKGNGKSITRAEVRVGTKTFFTDPSGEIRIQYGPQDQTALIEKKGFEKYFIDLKSNTESQIDVYLYPGQPDDEEVVVTGKRREAVSRKTVTIRETRRIAPGGDPAQVTKLLPGVQSNSFGGEVVIRGSGPNDSRYYIDDINVPGIFHNVSDLSIVYDQLLEDVQFDAGGFGPRYGNATGGIIVLRTNDLIPERQRTEFKINVPFYLGLFYETPLSSDSSLTISVRRSTIETILPQVLPDELDTTVVPFFADVNVRYLKKRDDGHLKLTGVFSLDGLTLATPSSSSDQEDGKIDVSLSNRYGVLGLENYQRLSEDWRLRTTPYFSYSRIKINFGSDNFYLTNFNFNAPTEATYRLDTRQFLYLGFDPQWFNAKVEAQAPQIVNDDPFFDPEDAPRLSVNRRFDGINGAAWTAIDFLWGPLYIQPGMRLNYDSLIQKSVVDPRFITRYEISDKQNLKFAIGQYSIAPEPAEASEEFGNPDLDFETSNHYVLGWENQWSERWTSELQLFYKKTYQLIFSTSEPQRYNNNGSRISQGFEVFVRRNLTEKFFGWLSYTYSKSEERKSDDDPWFTSPFDQTHILNLAGSYKLTALWDLGLRFKYNTATPYTPVTSSVYNPNLDKYRPVYDEQNPYSKRLSDNNALDIFATYESLYDRWKLAYQFGIQYISFGKQASSIQYNYDYSKQDNLMGLPPIPYIQITGEF